MDDPGFSVSVSHHAVTRYVHRVLLIRPSIDTRNLSNEEVAEQTCRAAGYTSDMIKAAILTDKVIRAAQTGVDRVRTDDFLAAIAFNSGQPVVTTILRRDHRGMGERSRLSPAERQREQRRAARRHRSMPSTAVDW